MREVSETKEEYQVTNDEMESFKATIDKAAKETYIINGDQDDDIQAALKAIDKDIQFSRPKEGACTIQ